MCSLAFIELKFLVGSYRYDDDVARPVVATAAFIYAFIAVVDDILPGIFL